jgi:uncharacterized protein (DUF39 family)
LVRQREKDCLTLINAVNSPAKIGFERTCDFVQRLDSQIEARVFDLSNISAVESAQGCEIILV